MHRSGQSWHRVRDKDWFGVSFTMHLKSSSWHIFHFAGIITCTSVVCHMPLCFDENKIKYRQCMVGSCPQVPLSDSPLVYPVCQNRETRPTISRKRWIDDPPQDRILMLYTITVCLLFCCVQMLLWKCTTRVVCLALTRHFPKKPH